MDTYLCPRHGAFQVSSTGELIHVPSDRCWHQWELLAASRRLKWSLEGAFLASANQDNSVGVLTWAQVHRLRQTPVDPTDLPTLLQGFPGKVRQLAWADIPDADKSPILAAATRDLVVMGMLVPGEDWESWLLDLHNGTVLDVAFQPKTGLLASLSEDGWIILWQAAVNAAQILEGAKGGFLPWLGILEGSSWQLGDSEGRCWCGRQCKGKGG